MLFVSNVLSEESVSVYDDIIDKRVEWIIEHLVCNNNVQVLMYLLS